MPSKPSTYLKLRAELIMNEMTMEELGRHLLLQPCAMTARMTARKAWSQDEMYAVMDVLDLSTDQLHIYFPRHGITVQT